MAPGCPAVYPLQCRRYGKMRDRKRLDRALEADLAPYRGGDPGSCGVGHSDGKVKLVGDALWGALRNQHRVVRGFSMRNDERAGPNGAAEAALAPRHVVVPPTTGGSDLAQRSALNLEGPAINLPLDAAGRSTLKVQNVCGYLAEVPEGAQGRRRLSGGDGGMLAVYLCLLVDVGLRPRAGQGL